MVADVADMRIQGEKEQFAPPKSPLEFAKREVDGRTS
jgi:hypothetical protein